jgi:hypothetical protein
MHFAKLIVPMIAAVFAGTPVLGSITFVGLVPVDNASGGAALVGFNTYDVTINSTTDWTAGAILLELSPGDIYQHANGSASGLAPNPSFLGFPGLEALRFDTFVTNPDASSEVGAGASIAGGALDIPGAGVQEFSTSRLSVAWNSPDTDTDDIGEIVIGRLTLKDTANGTLWLALTEAGSAGKTLISIPIVPEPASLALLGLGGLAALCRR